MRWTRSLSFVALPTLILGAEQSEWRKQDDAFFRSRGISFYASFDESLDADYSAGRAKPVPPLFPPTYKQQGIAFEPGRYDKCASAKTMYLVYDAMRVFHPDRGAVSFWFKVHDRDIWTLFMVRAREAGVGPNSRRQMDLYHGTFLFGTSPVLRPGFYRALIRPVFEAIDGPMNLGDFDRNAWHHFVWTWDSTQGMRVSLDGREVFDNWGTVTWVQMMTPNLAELRSIKTCDDLLFFSRSLTPKEALGLYRGELPRPEKPAGAGAIPRHLRRAIAHNYGLDELPEYPVVQASTSTVFTPVKFTEAKDGKRPTLYCLDGNRVSCWPLSHIEVVNTDRLDVYYPPGTKANYFRFISDGTRFSLTKDNEDEPFWTDEVRPELDGWEDKLVRRHVTEKLLAFEKLTLDRKGSRIGEFYVYNVGVGGLAIPDCSRVALTLSEVVDLRSLAWEGGVYQLYHNHLTPVAIGTREKREPSSGTLSYEPLIPFHLVTEPFPEQTGIAGLALQLACTRPEGKQEDVVRLRIVDPITKERDLINVDFRLRFDPSQDGAQVFQVSFDMRDIVMNAGRRLWVWLVSKSGGKLDLARSGMTVCTVPVAKAAEQMVPDTMQIVKHSYQVSSEGHAWSRSYKLAGNEQYHYEWSDWAGLTNIIKQGLAPQDEIVGLYWHTLRPQKLRDYPENREYRGLPYREPQAPEEFDNPTNAPDWALYQNELLKVMLRIGQWWHDHRLVYDKGVLGGYGDDTQLTGEMFWLYFATGDKKILRMLRSVSDGTWKHAGWYRGFPSRTNDIGHNAEEVSGAYPLMVLADYGNPRYLEMVMECMSLIDFLTIKTKLGHRHFRSWYYSSTEIVTDGAMGVDNFGNSAFTLIGHPLAWYSRHPKLTEFYREWCDAWLEDLKRARTNGMKGPFVIGMPQDEPLEHAHHRPYTMPHQFMIAGLLTGDRRYIERALRNDDDFFVRYYYRWGEGMLLRDFAFMRHRLREDESIKSRKTVLHPRSAFAKYFQSGDKSILAEAYKSSVQSYLSGKEYLYTEGQPSTDRLWGMNNETMYLAILGGRPAGHRDTSNWPGLAISFTDAGTDLASLVLVNRVDRVSFLLHNFDRSRKCVDVRVWQLEPGRYALTVGPDADGDDVADSVDHERQVDVRRGATLTVPLPQAKLLLVNLRQVSKTDEPQLLPDLAISPRDVEYDPKANMLEVIVHSVGSAATGSFTVMLQNRESKTVASKRMGSLDAPLDLKPRRTVVRFRLDPESWQTIHRVAVQSSRGALEITADNNAVEVR